MRLYLASKLSRVSPARLIELMSIAGCSFDRLPGGTATSAQAGRIVATTMEASRALRRRRMGDPSLGRGNDRTPSRIGRSAPYSIGKPGSKTASLPHWPDKALGWQTGPADGQVDGAGQACRGRAIRG